MHLISYDSFSAKLFHHLGQLRLALQNATWQPSAIALTIAEENAQVTANPCLISIETRDAVLHQALAQTLQSVIPVTTSLSANQLAYQQFNLGFRWCYRIRCANAISQIQHEPLLQTILLLTGDAGLTALTKLLMATPIARESSTTALTRGLIPGLPESELMIDASLEMIAQQISSQTLHVFRRGYDFYLYCDDASGTAQALALLLHQLAAWGLYPSHHSPEWQDLAQAMHANSVTQAESLIFDLQAATATAIDENAQRDVSIASYAEHKPANDMDITIDSVLPGLKTLFLASPGLSLRIKDNALWVYHQGMKLSRHSLREIDQIFMLNAGTVSTAVIAACAEARIGVHIVDFRNRIASCMPPLNARDASLRKCQYVKATTDVSCIAVARQIVLAKLNNSRLIAGQFLRHHPASSEIVSRRINELKDFAIQAGRADNLDALRGYEGAAARAYFELLRSILPPEWSFGPRTKRPAADGVNALLSYGYAILAGNIETITMQAGLDPACGYLHATRDGHPALVSDLMEPYRAVIVDACVLTLIFRHQINAETFMEEGAEGTCVLTAKTRRLLIERIEAKFNHAPAHQCQDFRRLIGQDIAHLCKFIQGEHTTWEPLNL